MKISIITSLIEKDLDSFNEIISTAELLKTDYEIIAIFDDVKEINVNRLTCYSDSNKDKIKFVFNDEPIGLFESRRKGIELASGDNIWFVDATDRILIELADEKIYNDYEIVAHDKQFTFDNSRYFNAYPQKNSDVSLNDYMNLNPISNKYITEMYMNNSIGNFIFKKDFIKKVYNKLPEIKGLNKFASLYLTTAALRYSKSLRYVPKTIYIYNYKDKYFGGDEYGLDNVCPSMACIKTDEMFNSKDVENFLNLLEDDKLKIKTLISQYIKDITEIK